MRLLLIQSVRPVLDFVNLTFELPCSSCEGSRLLLKFFCDNIDLLLKFVNTMAKFFVLLPKFTQSFFQLLDLSLQIKNDNADQNKTH